VEYSDAGTAYLQQLTYFPPEGNLYHTWGTIYHLGTNLSPTWGNYPISQLGEKSPAIISLKTVHTRDSPICS